MIARREYESDSDETTCGRPLSIIICGNNKGQNDEGISIELNFVVRLRGLR